MKKPIVVSLDDDPKDAFEKMQYFIKEYIEALGPATSKELDEMALKISGVGKVYAKGGVIEQDFTDHLVGTPVKGNVKVEFKSSDPAKVAEYKDKELSASQLFSKEKLMMIDVRCGKTINLGNYESARIDIGISVPCDKGGLEEAYTFATDWIDVKMQEALKGAK